MFLKRLLVCFLFVSGIAFGQTRTAQQFDCLMSGLTDPSTGDPLSGGLVYTYVAGTTINKTTWTNASKTTTAPNPITLDAYGRYLAFGDGKYKFVVKTSAGTTLYTWDSLEYNSVSTLASDTSNPHGASISQSILFVEDLYATAGANLNMDGYKVTALGTGTANQDAVNVGQMNATLTAAIASISIAHGRQIFTSIGSWTCPAGVSTVYVTGAAGGGGGAVASYTATFVYTGGGGGSGDATRTVALTVVASQVYSILIGAGGAQGAVGSATSIASGGTTLLTLAGGYPGTYDFGGLAGGNYGAAGAPGIAAAATDSQWLPGGVGGGNVAGGVGGQGDTALGGGGGIFGGGGVGGLINATTAGAGGAGGSGFILLEW